MRSALVDYFREEGRIMIATEAGAEGINLQFCSLVVNYDLPWNPQRIEQRIGRCHRYGQKHDVVVVNFLNRKNAADQRVYELLSEKFQLFEGVFGASDEVLGAIESGVDFEKRIAAIYQRCRKHEEIKIAFDQLQLELSLEINESMTLTRRKLLENFDDEVREKLKVRADASIASLNRMERWLMQLTAHALRGHAEFRDDSSFVLKSVPESIRTTMLKLRAFSTRFSSACLLPLPARQERGEDRGEGFINHSGASSPRPSPPSDGGEGVVAASPRWVHPCSSVVEIPLGFYELPRRSGEAHLYRLHHPLAEAIVAQAKGRELPVQEVCFDYGDHDGNISILEPLVGKSGWLTLSSFTVESLDQAEDHLRFGALTDEGTPLDDECAARLFTLPGKVTGPCLSIAPGTAEVATQQRRAAIQRTISERNARFFEAEAEKLDGWADDLKLGLEREIKEIDRQIKDARRAATTALTLEEKLAGRKQIKVLEAHRSLRLRSLFDGREQVDKQHGDFIADIEGKLTQESELKALFTIRWQLE